MYLHMKRVHKKGVYRIPRAALLWTRLEIAIARGKGFETLNWYAREIEKEDMKNRIKMSEFSKLFEKMKKNTPGPKRNYRLEDKYIKYMMEKVY